MKSEKALKVIEETAFRNNFYCNVPLGQSWTKVMHIYDVKTAVELAEQEAEERMREKAIKAYCHDCSCAVEYICDIGADNCLALQGFIQKLNEE